MPKPSLPLHGMPGQCAPEPSVPDMMQAASAEFAALITAVPAARLLPPPAVPPCLASCTAPLAWDNMVWTAPGFRRAHLERFTVPGQFAVLHVCIFPHVHDPAPVFGFDMLGGQDLATGVFLDFSPVVAGPALRLADVVDPATRAACGVARPTPDWGTMFSADFLAVRPRGRADIATCLSVASTCLAAYLAGLGTQPDADPACVIAGQAAYALGQASNPHTARLLARYVGPQAARHFIDTVLFPPPALQNASLAAA